MTTILVVDDEPAIRRYVRGALEPSGYGVVEAADGAQALELARRARPALVLLDLALPGVGGLEIRRQMREDPTLSGTPVLLCSGLLPQPVQEAIERAGPADWIRKPFTPKALLERIEALLGAPAPSS